MFASAAVGTPIHLESLCITILFPGLCADMMQFPSVMADVVLLIFMDPNRHVVIFPDSPFLFESFLSL